MAGVGAVGLHGVYDDQSAPTGPAKTPTTARADAYASAIVDDPHAVIVSGAVLVDQPDARAIVWKAPGKGVALAVTTDGFHTRTTLQLSGANPEVTAAGPNAFFVAQPGRNELVSPGGEFRAVRMTSAPGRLETGEVLAATASGSPLAIDPHSAVGHPLTVPADAHEIYGAGGLVWTITWTATRQGTTRNAVEWSTDGGLTWARHELPSGVLAIYTRVPSADGTIAVSRTGDVTLTPLSQLVVSENAGASWRTVVEPRSPMAAVDWTAALPDGTLLADVIGWSDQRAGRPSRHPTGLFASLGRDWSRLLPVHPRFPDGEPITLTGLVTTSTENGTLVLWVQARQPGTLLTSSDGGRSWVEARSR